MKLVLIAASFMLSVSGFAADSITLVLRAQDLMTKKPVDLPGLNPSFKARGLPGFPQTVTLDKDGGKTWLGMVGLLEKSAPRIGRKLKLPANVQLGEAVMCYTGNPEGIATVLKGLMGTVFHPKMEILAERNASKRVVHNLERNIEVRSSDWSKFHFRKSPKAVGEWFHYDKTSAALLVLTDYGDPTELRSTLIPRCDKKN